MGDYLKDTSRLSLLEHGAYSMLLAYYYAEERPIPLDHEEVFRMVRAIAPAERKAIEKVLAGYFERRADGYHNARADHEVEVSRKARDNGARGGRPITGIETGTITGLQTGTGTGAGGGSGHPPTTNRQPLAATPQTTNLKPRSKAEVAAVPLPAWLNPETWGEWLKVRKAKSNTPGSLKAALAKLEKFREQGHDANEIVATSLANGWQGLFAPDPKSARQGKQGRLEAGNAAAARAFAESVE